MNGGRGKKEGRGKKVLIVDNDESTLMILQKVLEREGFDTCLTWSGHEALELLRSQNFDVLLVDDYLPDLHHHDFLARVSRLPLQPWVVVMQATEPTQDDRRQYAELGAFAVVAKHHIGKVCKAALQCTIDEPLARAYAN